jgi:hypothetical protein
MAANPVGANGFLMFNRESTEATFQSPSTVAAGVKLLVPLTQ